MTIGCMRAKMGSTVYYICKMAAGELVDQVDVCSAGSAPGLKKSITGRDLKKMINESVPDVVQNPDRFFAGLFLTSIPGSATFSLRRSPKLWTTFLVHIVRN